MEINPNIPYYIEKEGKRIVLSPINDNYKRNESMPFSILPLLSMLSGIPHRR